VTKYSLSETEYSFSESTQSDWFFGQLSDFLARFLADSNWFLAFSTIPDATMVSIL
jgi:hypothetical protein